MPSAALAACGTEPPYRICVELIVGEPADFKVLLAAIPPPKGFGVSVVLEIRLLRGTFIG